MIARIRSSMTRFEAYAGLLLVILGAVAFSTKAIFVKLAYGYGVDPVTLLTLRMAFALPFFIIIAIHTEFRAVFRPAGRQVAAVIGLGLVGYYLAALFDFMGLQYVSAGLERMVLFSYPTITVLLSMLMFGHKPSRHTVLALFLSYAGIGLAVAHEVQLSNEHVAWGTMLVFASAASYAMYLVGSSHMISQLGTIRFTSYAMVVSSLAVIVQFLSTRHIGLLIQPDQVYVLGFAMAVVSTVFPAFLISAGIQRIGAGPAAMAASVGPVSTIILASLILGEPMTFIQICGLVLVLSGVGLIVRRDSVKPS